MHTRLKCLVHRLPPRLPLRISARFLSTEQLHPSVRDFTVELGRRQPCFPVLSKHVRILSQPHEFYSTLLSMIRRAKARIFISSLYIGSSETQLLDALHEALRTNPSLHVYLHLDFNRSTRPGSSSTAHLLLPIMRSHPDRVHVHLFRSPKLKGLMAKLVPRRFDEGWGTWHAKVYGVDDELIISGANLNESYFTNRQDRYLHFTSHSLAQYCFNFLRAMVDHCYRLQAPSEADVASDNTPYTLIWPNPIHPERIEQVAEAALRQFQERQLALSGFQEKSEAGEDVLVFPLIQSGQFGIREEEQSLELLFEQVSRASRRSEGDTPLMDLTSGYFGLYARYQDFVRQSSVDCRILAASPKANGFYGSRGISGRIPEGYTLLEQRFWAGIRAAGRGWRGAHGVQLGEWARAGWTYHAKGIWLAPRAGAPPVLTLFGSTNLSSRSANLDTELAFVMVVSSAAGAHGLRERLSEELAGLRQFAEPWKGEERKVRLWTKVLVSLVGGML